MPELTIDGVRPLELGSYLARARQEACSGGVAARAVLLAAFVSEVL